MLNLENNLRSTISSWNRYVEKNRLFYWHGFFESKLFPRVTLVVNSFLEGGLLIVKLVSLANESLKGTKAILGKKWMKISPASSRASSWSTTDYRIKETVSCIKKYAYALFSSIVFGIVCNDDKNFIIQREAGLVNFDRYQKEYIQKMGPEEKVHVDEPLFDLILHKVFKEKNRQIVFKIIQQFPEAALDKDAIIELIRVLKEVGDRSSESDIDSIIRAIKIIPHDQRNKTSILSVLESLRGYESGEARNHIIEAYEKIPEEEERLDVIENAKPLLPEFTKEKFSKKENLVKENTLMKKSQALAAANILKAVALISAKDRKAFISTKAKLLDEIKNESVKASVLTVLALIPYEKCSEKVINDLLIILRDCYSKCPVYSFTSPVHRFIFELKLLAEKRSDNLITVLPLLKDDKLKSDEKILKILQSISCIPVEKTTDKTIIGLITLFKNDSVVFIHKDIARAIEAIPTEERADVIDKAMLLPEEILLGKNITYILKAISEIPSSERQEALDQLSIFLKEEVLDKDTASRGFLKAIKDFSSEKACIDKIKPFLKFMINSTKDLDTLFETLKSFLKNKKEDVLDKTVLLFDDSRLVSIEGMIYLLKEIESIHPDDRLDVVSFAKPFIKKISYPSGSDAYQIVNAIKSISPRRIKNVCDLVLPLCNEIKDTGEIAKILKITDVVYFIEAELSNYSSVIHLVKNFVNEESKYKIVDFLKFIPRELINSVVEKLASMKIYEEYYYNEKSTKIRFDLFSDETIKDTTYKHLQEKLNLLLSGDEQLKIKQLIEKHPLGIEKNKKFMRIIEERTSPTWMHENDFAPKFEFANFIICNRKVMHLEENDPLYQQALAVFITASSEIKKPSPVIEKSRVKRSLFPT